VAKVSVSELDKGVRLIVLEIPCSGFESTVDARILFYKPKYFKKFRVLREDLNGIEPEMLRISCQFLYHFTVSQKLFQSRFL
jgi:hypothetical protein